MIKQQQQFSTEKIQYIVMNESLIYAKKHLESCILNQEDINYCLQLACNNNKTNLVECLLTTTEISLNADIHYKDDIVIHCATECGNTRLVKCLLTSLLLNTRLY